MTQHLARLEHYKQYNGFYARPDVRAVIAGLYRGKCALTNDEISLEEGEVGHIVPRSKPEIFAEMYPDVDIDNVINLHWIRKDLNRRNANADNPSPLAIHAAIAYSSRIVDQRLSKLLKPKPAPKKQTVSTSKAPLPKKTSYMRAIEKFGNVARDALSEGKTVCFFDGHPHYTEAFNDKDQRAALVSLAERIVCGDLSISFKREVDTLIMLRSVSPVSVSNNVETSLALVSQVSNGYVRYSSILPEFAQLLANGQSLETMMLVTDSTDHEIERVLEVN